MTDTRRTADGSLVWLFSIIAVIGIALVFALGQFMSKIDAGNKIDAQQVEATRDLVAATADLNALVVDSNQALEVGRYERIVFQIDQRELVCLDLQDGDAGATPDQIAECAEDYITLPPKPEGYDQ